ncbi:MAG: 1-(5-phosphoribosyl)-5-[(5-phosphoribosylamino)methylideneamino]imidazole-4-carboxamide isomerase [Aureispira sp.]
MLEIIPAIDLINGQCVRLTQGDYQQKKVYNNDPVAMAQEFEAAGITRLHLVDLDGAKARKVMNLEVLRKIAQGTNLTIDFGGGVQSEEDLQKVLEAGATQVTAGSLAVKQPEIVVDWLERYGTERIILGADVLNGNIAIHGWQEESEENITIFLERYTQKGVEYCICTDVSKDGLLKGTALELYQELRLGFPDLKLIASGGVRTLAELVALKEMGCYGVIIGKALYEGHLPLSALRNFILQQQVLTNN